MKREEYRAILSRLPIKKPTEKDLAKLCPHLTVEEVEHAFQLDYVALPPLRVKHGYHVLHHSREWVDVVEIWRHDTQVATGLKNHPEALNLAYTSRTKSSYCEENRYKYGENPLGAFATRAAMNFAEFNWGADLVLDSWASYVGTHIQDPTDLVNDKLHRDSPRTKAVLTSTLNRELNAILNDHSKPESELFDDAIVEMTLDHLVARELKGGRGTATDFHCAICGSALSLDCCRGCGYRFRDNGMRGVSMDTPLSRKMVAFLREHKHEFKVDPEEAWATERAKWEERRARVVARTS